MTPKRNPSGGDALAELRERNQWVVWRKRKRNGKATKIPYQPTSLVLPAKSSDPKTWGTYEQAFMLVRAGQADGIGYAFAPDDPYTGVDLDRCIDENGTLHPAAAAIVARLDSYAEVSPSGTGLHIIVRASLNGGRKSTRKTPWGDEFATYNQGRYFAMTEQRLPDAPDAIHDRQAELDAIRAELLGAPVNEPAPLPAAPPPAASSTDTTPLTGRIDALREADDDADQAWLRKGPPPPNDSSPSAWCLRLANYAVRAGWTDPQITDLLRAYRRKHNDSDKHPGFYETTIAKARTSYQRQAAEQAEKDAVAEAVAELKDLGRALNVSREQPVAALNQIARGLQATELVQQGDDDDARFAIRTATELEIQIGTSKQLLDPDHVAAQILAKTHGAVVMPTIKRDDWRHAVRGLGKAVRYIEGESDNDETLSWIHSYLDGRIAVEEHWVDAAYNKQPFERQGFTHLPLADFHRYVKRGQGEAIKRPDLQRRITRIGFESQTVNCGPPGGRRNETSRTVWTIPSEKLR